MTNVAAFTGVGVLVDGEIVYSRCNQCVTEGKDTPRSLCEHVRNKDYPQGRLVKWAQSTKGGPTVFEVIE